MLTKFNILLNSQKPEFLKKKIHGFTLLHNTKICPKLMGFYIAMTTSFFLPLAKHHLPMKF
jgi:hypothetical protein